MRHMYARWRRWAAAGRKESPCAPRMRHSQETRHRRAARTVVGMSQGGADERLRTTEFALGDVDVRLLGDMEVHVEGVPVTDPRSRRLQALVALLALNRSARCPRASLARQLWPDAEPGQDLANLRRLLVALRQRWPLLAACLEIDPAGLAWRFPERVRVDVLEFEALALTASTEAALRQALSLYRGDFLAGSDDAWALAERERWRGLQIGVADRLATLLEEERRYADAFAALAALTPLAADESLCERLLCLAALSGGAWQVERAYALVAERFASQFDGAPTERLQAARERLKAVGHARPADEPLVGRQGEWSHLVRAWRACQAGRPTLVWLQGEAGIGKTSLLRELRAWARAYGASVFDGQAVGEDLRPPLAPVVEALGRDQGTAPAMSQAAQLRAIDAHALRMRRFSVLLADLLGAEPALLTLDDMHNADPDTWQWLRFALNARARARLMIVVASRDDAPPRARRKDLFYALAGHVVRSVLALRPLAPPDAERVVATQAQLPPATVGRVVELGKGNPLLLLELARLAERSGGGMDALALGPTFEAALETRLEALRPEERRLLQAMAVLGQPWRPEWLVQAVPTARRRALDRLVQLRLAAVDESGAVALAHDLLRAPVLARLSPARKRDLAGGLAAVSSALPGALGACAVARLWEAAGRLDEARACYREAALRWEDRLSLEDALPAYEALVRLSVPAERCAYQVRLADVLYARGERLAARMAYGEAMHRATAEGRPDVAAEARVGLGRVLGEEGDAESALLYLDESVLFFRAQEAPRALALALLRRAEVVGFRADYVQARRLLNEARDLCVAVGDGALEAETLNNLGFLEYELGHLWRALDLCARAQKVAEVAGSASAILMATGNLGVVHEALGHIRAAASCQRDAADLAYRSHLLQDLCYALGNLGACYQNVGQWQEAARCVHTAHRLASDLHDARAVSIIANLVAHAFGQAGDIPEASRWWRQALSAAHAFGMPRHVAWYAGAWAEVLLDAGLTAQAAAVLREAWPKRRWARELERISLHAQYLRWACAVGRLRPEQARRRLAEAYRSATAPEARALGQYATWQITREAEDRAAAQASVGAVLSSQPYVRWQRYYLALSGDVVRLPELDPAPAWLEQLAPPTALSGA